MEGRKIESVLGITSEENITSQQEKYIELCKQVLEVRDHYFKRMIFSSMEIWELI